MGTTHRSKTVLHGSVDGTDPEDSDREPGSSQVLDAAEVQPDDTTVHVRGRRIEEDVSVVEGIGTLIHPRKGIVGTTTYRRWTAPVGQSNGLGPEQTNPE
jgi:hypothetical protein